MWYTKRNCRGITQMAECGRNGKPPLHETLALGVPDSVVVVVGINDSQSRDTVRSA